MEPLSFYLAGKIAKNDWRHKIVRGLGEQFIGSCGSNAITTYNVRSKSADEDVMTLQWRPLRYAIADQHHYVGPFFVSDDHGCFHGSNSHGFICTYDAEYSPYRDGINSETGEALQYPNESYNPEFRTSLQSSIVRRCLAAIRDCDVFYAWLDDPSAFGTLAEIGYARSFDKFVIIAGPQVYDDLWFVYRMASRLIFDFSDPTEALMRVVRNYETTNEALSRTESPIEEMFYLAALRTGLTVDPQYSVGSYRIDFAIPERFIAIELDGHDYHKTKEQRTNDAQRERYLQENGWTVIRFTGSEVYKDASGCVDQVLRILERLNGHTHEQHG